MLRRAAQAGFTADEVAAATFGAATERKRPGPHVHVLFAECTNADATFDAERVAVAFPEIVRAEGTLLEELPERLDRFHYDLVATTTFHADEAQALVAGRVPVVAMLVGPGYVDLIHEIAVQPPGTTIGLVCASVRGVSNIAETLAFSGTTGVSVVMASLDDESEMARIDKEARLILLSREALAKGLDERFERQERIREWTYGSIRPAWSCSAEPWSEPRPSGRRARSRPPDGRSDRRRRAARPPIRERLDLDAGSVSAAGTVRLGLPAVARVVAHELGSCRPPSSRRTVSEPAIFLPWASSTKSREPSSTYTDDAWTRQHSPGPRRSSPPGPAR